MTIKLGTFIITTLLTMFLGLYPSKPLKGKLFFYTGFYFVFTATLIWLFRLVKNHHRGMRQQLIHHWPGLILSLVLMTAIFIIAPPQYKILNDEALLTGTSLSFYNHQIAQPTVRGIFNETTPPQFYPNALDKRPLFYPFCLFMVHALTGYRAENAFVLNYLSGLLILFITYAWIRYRFNDMLAICALILLASTPVFVFWITSAGFEGVTLLILMITFSLFAVFLRQKTIENAELLLFTFILLAQCRYESILFPAIIVGFMMPFILKNKSHPNWSYFIGLSPALMLPVIWQRLFFLHPAKILVEREIGPGMHFFGLDHFIQHFAKNIYVFLGIDPNFGFTPVLAILGLIGFYLVLRKLLLRHTDLQGEDKQLFWASLLCVLVFSILVFAHYFGDFTHPILHRISILYLPFFVAYATIGLQAMVKKWHFRPHLLIVPFCFLFILYWPYGARQNLLRWLTIKIEYNKTVNYLKDAFPDRKNTLIFCDRQNFYIINNYKAEDIRWANANQAYVWQEVVPFFDHVLFIQRFHYTNKQPVPTCQTAPGFRLHRLKTIKLSYAEYLVISELWLPNQKI